MLAGWAAIAVAVLTVTGLVTLFAFFGTGARALGVLNDVNTILMAAATVPVALALRPIAARAAGGLAWAAVGVDLIGVVLAAGVSLLMLAHVWTADTALLVISVGNGLIGVWLLLTSALLVVASAVPGGLGWLGIAGGAGLAVTALAFPLLGGDHPVIGVGGVVALVGLVGFFGWVGTLLLSERLPPG
jgi:hypothetical protein